MTAGQQIMHGSAGGGVPSTLPAINVNSNGAGVTSSARFNNDGSITYVQTGGSTVGPVAWYGPVGGTPGNSYWIRCNVGAGSLTQNDAAAFTALTVNRTFRITVAGAATQSASGTFQIALDAGGVTIVSTGTWALSCN